MVNKLNVNEKMPTSGSVKKVVIFLHGYGADGADLFSLSEPLSEQLPDCFFASPDAPRKCGASPFGFEWFPIPDIDGSTIPDMMKALASSENSIIKLIDGYKKRFSLDYSDIILLGFSQGCMMSLNVGLTSEEKFLCIVGFSGKIIDQNNLKLRIKNHTETLLIHGDADQVVPSTHLLEAKDFLIRNDVKVDTLLIKNCDHHIPIQASSTALNYILKKL